MKEQLEQRLNDLKAEFESGQKTLAGLEAKEAELKSTILRISGAIQVLEEELGKESKISNNGSENVAQRNKSVAQANL